MAAGYDPELPGLDEARLDGYRDLLISNIGLPNTARQRDRVREIGEVTATISEHTENSGISSLHSLLTAKTHV